MVTNNQGGASSVEGVLMALRRRVKFEWGWAEADIGKAPVRVGDRLIPPQIEVHFAGADGQPTLDMCIETRRGGVPECSEVRLVRTKGGRAVRTLDLKAIRIADWVADISATFADRIIAEQDGTITTVVTGTDADSLDAVRTLQKARTGTGARTLNRAHLERVAKVYRDHLHHAPTQAVADAFGVSRAMASKYVRMCRDQKLLGETSPGKKGS